MTGDDKLFVSPAQLFRDSFQLARRIFDSGYRPEVLLVLWRGGTPVGIVIHEYLLYRGIQTYHTAVKAESYQGIGRHVEPRLEHLGAVLKAIPRDSRVLIVDDIFDSGATIAKLCESLRPLTPHIRCATLYYRPDNNVSGMQPDFYMRETAQWVVFPHELMDLSAEEIRRKDPLLAELLHP